MNEIGLLLDFDGTIIGDVIWDEFDWERERKKISRMLGEEVSKTRVEDIAGRRGMKKWEQTFGKMDVSSEDYWKLFATIQKDMKIEQLENGKIDKCSLSKLEKIGNKYIVSNSPKLTLEKVLEHLGIIDGFQKVIGPSRFGEHRKMKPDPFLLEKAMEGEGEKHFIMVGNTWRDRQAAENAGIPWRTVENPFDTDKVIEKYY